MRESQAHRILQYMQEEGSITPHDALREFGCMRLASRIHDLKEEGYHITKTMEYYKNPYGETIRFARYRLEG